MASIRKNGLKILIVEPKTEVCAIFQEQLKCGSALTGPFKDCFYDTVQNADEAFRKFEKGSYDAIVLRGDMLGAKDLLADIRAAGDELKKNLKVLVHAERMDQTVEKPWKDLGADACSFTAAIKVHHERHQCSLLEALDKMQLKA